MVDQSTTHSPTHKVDEYKNQVAVEVEWNNKDPFYDRDLNNFRLLFDLRVISVGIIITRMESWGFTYKTNIVWYKVRKDGGPDRRGVGFYFRNVTELVLFGVRGRMRTLQPGRTMPNIITSMKREHSRKPDQLYSVIEKCSPAPYIELFARVSRPGWAAWGNETGEYEPRESIYSKSKEEPGMI
jgi:N6-adenosine-specific RNA methylase IME4